MKVQKQNMLSSRTFVSIFVTFLFHYVVAESGLDDIFEESDRFTIEGKVYSPELYPSNVNWQKDTSISINNGEFNGYLKEDGTFVISNVPSGSYVVEIINPDYMYESVRVEINPKGKFRARKLNYIQPSQVIQVPYPLKLKAFTRFKYFQTREQWKITDFLFSPMVLMMILPLLLMLILPRMMSDPETKKEMENLNINKMTSEMPEISEMITSFFTGAPKKDDKTKTVSKTNKKRN